MGDSWEGIFGSHTRVFEDLYPRAENRKTVLQLNAKKGSLEGERRTEALEKAACSVLV